MTDERVALVTGAGSGIGQATARLLATRGARVVVADVDESTAADTAATIGANAAAVQVDVSEEESVAAMVAFAVERFGRLDWACNIAGITPAMKPFTEHTLAEWQRVIDVNLTGVFLCLQQELRQMLAQGSG